MESENKALVRRFYEQVWNQGNTGVAHEVFDDDYVRHDLRPTSATPGRVGQAKIAADFRAAFPDLVFQVDLMARRTISSLHGGLHQALTRAFGDMCNLPIAT
jgi:hypothetical protein